jgi:hypothetical protein
VANTKWSQSVQVINADVNHVIAQERNSLEHYG